MELLYSTEVIQSLEKNVIFRYNDNNPTLGVVIKKDCKPDEASYMKSLLKKAEMYHSDVTVREVKNEIEASSAIQCLRDDARIDGIIILSNFGEADQALKEMIPSRLDVDCASTFTLGRLMNNTSAIGYRFAPCAPVSVLKLLEYEAVDFEDLNIAIFGRSLTVGRPLAEILCQKGSTVTVFHSKSKKIHLDNYDVVVSAIGKPGFITPSLWEDKKNIENTKYIFDVGINVNEQGKICGDVDIQAFDRQEYDMKITPVPGCIGPLASTILFTKICYNSALKHGKLLAHV